ncbi:hypothetical protein MPS_5615 [Mycobacterium pseudoshottsii JCM 15466]|uniref:DUF1876 domain-containing protein n=2 Tax=Mycobacteriaceae TaxID=1762 RepID=A0A9N7LLR4_9MYCO|nr:hypothetical protein MMSP_4105 [Mycobacterium sp. 012931]MBC9860553.1 hypothetical protein [Mycobacterium pseudoshottsii]BBA87669.1 hypothetical protein MPSD_21030 [Mycobacterium pseudoshottsii JCM 15466]BDN81855.1 hypothetical protein NJB1907Z4_C20700 [Mycobacterium pseudoshottsii]GAQ41283.1 hypothetical protein MPS_5615 [Mycobacterium pseudoshottsii JCM 15466]
MTFAPTAGGFGGGGIECVCKTKETAMTGNTTNAKSCHVDVLIEERDERTRAKARLVWGDQTLVGIGLARLDPADEPVAQIGDELAIARALSDLANQLFAATSADIQASTHEPASGLHH